MHDRSIWGSHSPSLVACSVIQFVIWCDLLNQIAFIYDLISDLQVVHMDESTELTTSLDDV